MEQAKRHDQKLAQSIRTPTARSLIAQAHFTQKRIAQKPAAGLPTHRAVINFAIFIIIVLLTTIPKLLFAQPAGWVNEPARVALNQPPFTWVGRVYSGRSASADSLKCTAFLMGPRIAVTAGHCVGGIGYQYLLVFGFKQYSNDSKVFSTIGRVIFGGAERSRTMTLNHNGRARSYEYLKDDYAVLQLHDPMPSNWGHFILPSEPPQANEIVQALGFSGKVENGFPLMIDPSCKVLATREDQIFTNCFSRHGNSGGPIVRYGTNQVLGIASTLNPRQLGGGASPTAPYREIVDRAWTSVPRMIEPLNSVGTSLPANFNSSITNPI